MTADRFVFQRNCVEQVEGKVLNAGCKEDPAHLKATFGDRIINLDRLTYNEDVFVHEGREETIPVDVVHDITVFPWPFKDDEFGLVVLGDILEDLPDDGIQAAILDEARRIATHLCITTPEDGPERDAHHRTTITRERLKVWLDAAGWSILAMETVDYGFVPHGYFVYAKRYEDKPKRSKTSKRSI